MIPEEAEPTRDEMLAMAYVDGELDPLAARELAARIANEPALAREVAALRRLHVLARHAAGPEPIDHEWRRLARSPVHRGAGRLGWSLAIGGALALAGWLVVAIALSPLELVPKAALLALFAGASILLLRTVRARFRTLPYDAYREVER